MAEALQLSLNALTHVGLWRDHNEDSMVFAADLGTSNWNVVPSERFSLGERGVLLMVADGMGGMKAGEVASAIAVNTVKDVFKDREDWPTEDDGRLAILYDAIMEAHHKIAKNAEEHPERLGMGTTAVVAWLLEDKVYLAWSGDSRAYLYAPDEEGGQLAIVSEDHSLVWELVLANEISPEEARLHPESNIITQSLGDSEYPPSPDVALCEIRPGDRFLLCSDGLNGMISDDDIAIMMASDRDVETTAQELVDAALAAGGNDNITLILVDIFGEFGSGQHAQAPAAPLEVESNNSPPSGGDTQPIETFVSIEGPETKVEPSEPSEEKPETVEENLEAADEKQEPVEESPETDPKNAEPIVEKSETAEKPADSKPSDSD